MKTNTHSASRLECVFKYQFNRRPLSYLNKIKKAFTITANAYYNWLRGEDSNLRPLGYEPNELPTAPPRDV